MSQGCRPLDKDEIEKIKAYWDAREGDEDKDPKDVALRNKTLMLFTCYCGFRISEVLSIQITDIVRFGRIQDSVYLKKSCAKKKAAGRNAPINANCQALLAEYINHYQLLKGPLFPSTQGEGAITARMASSIFRSAFDACELGGKLGTHSGRKTFASIVYNALDRNIVDLQHAMGHQSLSSTQKYVAFDNDKIADVLDKLDF